MLAGRDPELAASTKVGRFLIDVKIGAGGMGVVYAAKDTTFLCDVTASVKALSIEQVTTAPGSTWQNAYCERIIGLQSADQQRHEMLLCRAMGDGLYPIGRLGGYVHQLWADDVAGQLRCFATLGPYADDCWELHNLLTAEAPAEKLRDLPDAESILASWPVLQQG